MYMEVGNGLSTLVGNLKIPSWNNAGRPANPSPGTFGSNFQTNNLEFWNGYAWMSSPMTLV